MPTSAAKAKTETEQDAVIDQAGVLRLQAQLATREEAIQLLNRRLQELESAKPPTEVEPENDPVADYHERLHEVHAELLRERRARAEAEQEVGRLRARVQELEGMRAVHWTFTVRRVRGGLRRSIGR